MENIIPLAQLVAENFSRAKEESEKYKAMITICPIPAWISDPAGKLIFVNQSYTDFTGMKLEDVQSKIETIYHKDNNKVIDSWDNYCIDPLAETYTWKRNVKITKKDLKTQECSVVATKIQNNGFVGFIYPRAA